MSDADEIDFCKNGNHTWIGAACKDCAKPIPTVQQTLHWAAKTIASQNAELSDLRAKLTKAVEDAANYEMDKHKAEAKLAEAEENIRMAREIILRCQYGIDEAICSEDGLDGAEGQEIMDGIDKVLVRLHSGGKEKA